MCSRRHTAAPQPEAIGGENFSLLLWDTKVWINGRVNEDGGLLAEVAGSSLVGTEGQWAIAGAYLLLGCARILKALISQILKNLSKSPSL